MKDGNFVRLNRFVLESAFENEAVSQIPEYQSFANVAPVLL